MLKKDTDPSATDSEQQLFEKLSMSDEDYRMLEFIREELKLIISKHEQQSKICQY